MTVDPINLSIIGNSWIAAAQHIDIVSLARPLFSVTLCDGGKKGRNQFTDTPQILGDPRTNSASELS